jgi:signal transduction histidine kinase
VSAAPVTENGAVTTLGARVLVVEDSPDHRLLMERALSRAGYTVVSAETGEEAMSRLLDVDVVLVDQRLPRMSGMDLLEEIARIEHGPAAVVVTGAGSQELVVGAMRRGAVDYVVKDSDYLGELPAVVERAYRQHDLSRRNRELQRFALLVLEPTARADTLHEIVTSARRLLRATGVCLALRPEKRWDVAATAGEIEPEEVRADLDRGNAPKGHLVVALPSGPDDPAGALVATRDGDLTFSAEERELAAAFAAFAASALRQVRRLELERGLIDQLQRSIQARQDFVASVSHELRTPLTAIGGYSETLLGRRGELPAELEHDLLARIRSNASELGRLIKQLLDVAGLERGRGPAPSLSRLDLPSAVQACLDDMQFHLHDREVTCDVPPLAVLADPELFGRTLVNLVSNAAKYSPAGSPIRVSAAAADGMVRLAVEDHGIGLDRSDAVRVFEPFWRAGYAVAEAVRGTGIGLALVREYVRSMGGEVGVDSTPGQGSTFWFTLPQA